MGERISDDELRRVLDAATPGPWRACREGDCQCSFVWSVTDDHPVATAEKPIWGDEYYVAAPTVDDPQAVERMFAEYGRFPESQARNNRLLIALAPALAAEVLQLREALRPFAAVAEHDIGDDETDGEAFRPMQFLNRAPKLTVGDLRRARAALTGGHSNG